mgnify:CR=1 FL=1
MNIEDILDLLDDMIDRAWSLPLTGGRCVVDAEKVRELLDDMRLNLPTEIKQAKAIVADRTEIVTVAKREAETIVRRAEERAKALVAQEEITRQAQAQASEILSQAQMKSKEMKAAANDFVDSILKQTEETLAGSLTEVKNTRKAIRQQPSK